MPLPGGGVSVWIQHASPSPDKDSPHPHAGGGKPLHRPVRPPVRTTGSRFSAGYSPGRRQCAVLQTVPEKCGRKNVSPSAAPRPASPCRSEPLQQRPSETRLLILNAKTLYRASFAHVVITYMVVSPRGRSRRRREQSGRRTIFGEICDTATGVM